eukprot:TRINITY_DN2828_c0_g2_i1.p1 TRINITY_DN2828_c0_g2~~TRINITY_DN2828_c0_g2_i1.p1  ORF type:complete len:2336 (+),score=540.50 TRINITY_DN2828_c0_g2_i1:45-7052(+)
MGIRGLLSYILRHRESGTTQRVDLIQEARHYGRDGLTLLVDLLDFCAWFLPEVDRLAKGSWEADSTLLVYGGEFAHYDEALSELIVSLRHAGIYLEFFTDPPRGSGLLDAATSSWSDEAKRRCAQGLDAAKAARTWCRGERNDLPESVHEARCHPPLWYDQVVASLTRCSSRVWQLTAEEQAPLLSMRRGSDWAHVWGVVSDNVDWAIVRGIRLIPFSCFDLDGTVKPQYREDGGYDWPGFSSFQVGFTSSDLLAEHLRLGHPPKQEEIKDYAAKGKGKGPVGHGQWPFKWWYDQALIELAALCGTDATTPLIQKHKLYSQIGLRMGQDPVDSIVRWFRDQLYQNKLRWRDVRLEALSSTLSKLADTEPEFGLALECTRKAYEQDVGGLQKIVERLGGIRWAAGEKAIAAAAVAHKAGAERDLPMAASLLLRSAALAGRVWLDVCLEDLTRLGAPPSGHLLSDLRRVIYLLVCRLNVSETRGDHGGVSSSKIILTADALPDAKVIQRWTGSHRWQLFRTIVEHNSLQAEASSWNSSKETEAAADPVESVVGKTFEENKSDESVPDWAHSAFCGTVLEYVVSLNRRPEQPMLRQHEFDSLLATLALCCDVALPGAPLGKAPGHVQQRMGEVKDALCNLVTSNFNLNSEVRMPIRGSSVAMWYQSSACLLMDLARLLWLDVDIGQGSLIFLPEPREIFSGTVFAALYMAGAYEAWELSLPESESSWHWEGVLNQMVELRNEVLWCNACHVWRKDLMSSLRTGTISWPTHYQLAEENKKVAGQDELPIDEHRDKILKHIETHRVTCIQGETGCGKSTRVPVYVMEDYFERKKAGKVDKDDKFMVLCTQPRRIACISLANRVASCIKENLGESIGYKISGDSKVRPGRTKLVYVTTGYLLQVLVNNPEQIRNYTHLILDEVHERDVDSDLLSLVIKLQMSGYNFKLVIMSATLQGDLFTRYFSEKKIKTIFVGVKRYPVEVLHVEQLLERYGGRYWDPSGKTEGTQGYQAPFSSAAMRAIKDAERAFGTGGYEAEGWEEEPAPLKNEFDESDSEDESDEDSNFSDEPVAKVTAVPPKKRRKEVQPQILRGLDYLIYELVLRVAQPGEGILIFLPGIGEISELQEMLMPLEDTEKQAHMSWRPGLERDDLNFKVFVLHSLIPKDEQEGAVFDPPPADTAHVILASNIAESSLTIPKVRIVIDFGLRRQLIYDKSRHMSCLKTTWVSQASAKQRCGRTGRVFEGVNIRLFTKQFFDTYMHEFDPPEMQTAPLDKLYVNVKHLSAKLPEYQVTPTEFRRRTPKELLMLVAQPPEESAIASSIENLDQLGALTSQSEEAELTVLGYLMMSVPLDVQLCRLVIFGALMGMPCEGVVCAAAASVQDPFTLPSHLIMKDPKEYAEAVRRSYETRSFFDQGHWSEPLMLRNLFVFWLSGFRKMMIEKSSGRGGRRGRESNRSAFTRCAQGMGHRFAIVPKRMVNLANAVLDTATRMRKFLPDGSEMLKQTNDLLTLLQAADRNFSSTEAAEEGLPKVSDLFSCDAWQLKALLVMSFSPQFMRGSTKVKAPEQQVQAYSKKKKAVLSKDKNKIEVLLQEWFDMGLDPVRTVSCVLELPRGGKGGSLRSSPRFQDDLALTLQMLVGEQEKFKLVLAADNKVLVCFEQVDTDDNGEQQEEQPSKGKKKETGLSAVKLEPYQSLGQESNLVTDLPLGAHYIDLFGGGRWKFPVNLLSTWKIEQEKLRAEKEAKRKEEEAKRKEEEAKRKKEQEAKRKEDRAKAAKAKRAERGEEEKRDTHEAAVAEEDHEEKGDKKGDETETVGEKKHDGDTGEEDSKLNEKERETPTDEGKDEHLEDEEEQIDEEEALPAPEVDNEGEEDEEEAGDEWHEEWWEEEEEELGPPISIFKPVTPYEVNWEIVDTAPEPVLAKSSLFGSKTRMAKPVKAKVTKGRCSWRNPVGFMGSIDIAESSSYEPYPNDMFAVYTTTQGGDSKDVSWVEGVTLLSTEAENLISFVLLMSFLREHQELSMDIDLMDGRIYSIKGPGGLELALKDYQVLLAEDMLVVNDLRAAVSEAFFSKAPPKIATVEEEDGIDFSGTRGKRDDEPVPQIADKPRVAEAMNRLLKVLRECSTRMETIDEVTWNRRISLSKSRREVVAMHRSVSRLARTSDQLFTLFEPLVDLAEVRKEAEQKEREEEMRRWQAEQEKQRKKEEERRRKEQEKQEKRLREQQRKEEERRMAALERKGKGKGKDEGKGKGKKGKQKEQSQPQPQKEKRSSRKAESSEDMTTMAYPPSVGTQPMAYQMPDLPHPWVAVPDPNTQRFYYWNRMTGETTWTKPVDPGFNPFFFAQ